MLDESEHVKTVNACQTQDELIISPNAAAANAGEWLADGIASADLDTALLTLGVRVCVL